MSGIRVNAGVNFEGIEDGTLILLVSTCIKVILDLCHYAPLNVLVIKHLDRAL